MLCATTIVDARHRSPRARVDLARELVGESSIDASGGP